MRLALPRNPTDLNAADLAFTIEYLVLTYFGTCCRDMSPIQKTRPDPGSSEVRAWARDLPLPKVLVPEEKPQLTPKEKRSAHVDKRAQRAVNMLAKYEVLEVTAAKELYRLGILKKKWEGKIAYYKKRGVL